jgi:patatin-like phospholipase/acyl hydrolase
MATYRILSLDGGGIRGIVSVVLMQRLAAERGLGRWLDRARLVAGTSTGGLIALGLAHGIDLAELRDLYETRGRSIFDDSWLDDLRDLGRIAGAEYGNRGLERELRRIFGRATLGDLKKRVLVPAFDLDNEDRVASRRTWKPKLFHNFPGSDSDGKTPAWKVGLYTSAAPTYFPSVDGYVDGGVFANNPSLCALTQALDRRTRGARTRLDDVVLLSIGTGNSLVYIEGRKHDWGYARWAKPLVSLILDGVTGIANYQCRQLLEARYHRLAPVFPPGTSLPLDAVARVPEMVAFAEGVDLGETIEFLRRHWA